MAERSPALRCPINSQFFLPTAEGVDRVLYEVVVQAGCIMLQFADERLPVMAQVGAVFAERGLGQRSGPVRERTQPA